MRVLERLSTLLSCPYQDQDCPKVSDLERTVSDTSERVRNVERLLYVVIGMITIEFGVVLI